MTLRRHLAVNISCTIIRITAVLISIGAAGASATLVRAVKAAVREEVILIYRQVRSCLTTLSGQ